jgi:glycosyltransferase involved in cell wall biosynthesis
MTQKKSKFYIQASNIHTGGGLTLLNMLIKDIHVETKIYVDERAKGKLHQNNKATFKYIKPKFLSRLLLELKLFFLATNQDTILFFTNLPPLFKTRSNNILFLQNQLLISSYNLKEFSLKNKFRISIERFLLKNLMANIDSIYVQSSEMLSLCKKKFTKPCFLMPFFASNFSSSKGFNKFEKKYDFIYVTSDGPHKNNIRLIKAFALLAAENIRPKLCLTFKPNSYSKTMIAFKELIDKNNLDISFEVFDSKESKDELYLSSKALIFPSEEESMGLPLLEAQEYSIDIIASEKGFTRDFIEPSETFDPSSSHSIARAIKRYLLLTTDKLSINSPEQFLNEIFSPS